MAYYPDFSEYKLNPCYQLEDKKTENVLNIGWLGEDGIFARGEVSNEFLMNLWEYYKCPVFDVKKIYNNQGLDGYWKFFVAIYNERRINLGKTELRIIDKKNGVVYAAPDLLIHYVVNHKYLPPKEFVEAVITGPKPNSEEFCLMYKETYSNAHKIMCAKSRCPYCNSGFLSFAYKEKKEFEKMDNIIVVDSGTIHQGKYNEDDYHYYQICRNCGRLSEY